MKKNNFKLESLKVKSFITAISGKHIIGAGDESEVDQTSSSPNGRFSRMNVSCKIL